MLRELFFFLDFEVVGCDERVSIFRSSGRCSLLILVRGNLDAYMLYMRREVDLRARLRLGAWVVRIRDSDFDFVIAIDECRFSCFFLLFPFLTFSLQQR